VRLGKIWCSKIWLRGLVGLKLQLECRGCIAVRRGVWPRRGGKRLEGGKCVVVGVRAHNSGGSFSVARRRVWLLESDMAYVARGKVGGRIYVVLDVLDGLS
jgi:hypothetical protein